MALQLIPKRRTLANPSLVHLFSTASSSSSSPADSDDQNDQSKSSTSTSGSPFSSSFSDVNASLRRQQPSTPLLRSPRTSFSPTSSFSPNSKAASLEESRKNLSEFRSRSEANSPAGSGRTPLFRDLYKRKVLGNVEDPNRDRSSGERLSFQEIFGSLKQMRTSENARTDGGGWGPRPLSAFKSGLRFKPSDSPSTPPTTTLLGGTDPLPQSVFGKEIREKTEADEPSAMKTEFVKMYTYKDLGEKLKILRPDWKDKGEGWFSMEELNERLARLREKDEKEADSRTSGQPFRDLRNALMTMKLSSGEEDKKKKASYSIMGLLRTPEYMKHPPKEHLVEKYFHPDNMSSAEKMKIELAKVREEFKMSESDCGSARVQVAQLTTKIKHLSAVLHKKDKHSRKGLLAMVQRRKRLLKYLRRSDWDSYCFVLDKLGLRDNPDLKN